MATNETRQIAERWQQLNQRIEELEDERDETARQLEDAARVLHTAKDGCGHAGSHVLRNVNFNERSAHFELIDSYDNSYHGSITLSFDDLDDVAAASQRLDAERHRAERDRARQRRAALQRELAQLDDVLDDTETSR